MSISSVSKPKVLMLGWEFPPLLAGGLGMACYGLARSISKYVDLTLLLPQAQEGAAWDDVNLKGLNLIQGDELGPAGPAPAYKEIKGKTYFVEHPGYDPYPYSLFQKEFYEEVVHKYGQPPIYDMEEVNDLFMDKTAYGPNIMYKAAIYADVVSRLVKKLDFDVIHAHDWVTYTAAVRIRNESRKPLVVHVHSLETDRVGVEAKYQEWNEVYRIEKMGMDTADAIVPVSHFTAQCAIEHYGADPNKMHPVYNSIDPLPTYCALGENKEKLVVFVGRVTHQKGPEFLLQTAEELLAKTEDIKFAIAGRGDMLDYLRGQVYEKGLQDRIIFLGFLSKQEVNDLLSGADAYFMPSVSEPFGLSALEAGQFDVPLVLSKQSGAAEVLDYSLTADYWDTHSFANYLYAAVNYPALAAELREGTTKQIIDMSWDNPAREVVDVYDKLLNS